MRKHYLSLSSASIWTRTWIIISMGAFIASCGGRVRVTPFTYSSCLLANGTFTTSDRLTNLCCRNDNAILPPPEGCPVPNDDVIADEALEPGAESVIRAAATLRMASAKVGRQGEFEVNSDPLKQSAATAGSGARNLGSKLVNLDAKAATQGDIFKLSNYGDPLQGKIGQQANTTTSQGRNSGLPQFSGLSNFGSDPEESPESEKTDPSQLDSLSIQSAAYSGGGAKKPGTKSGSFLSRLFSGNKSGQNNGGVKSTTFDRSIAGTPHSNEHSDPADYFSRIDVSRSLFKIVEKKYQEKSNQWAVSQSRQILKKLKSKNDRLPLAFGKNRRLSGSRQ